jgi:Spy/CpxP family protein refolding chaperone
MKKSLHTLFLVFSLCISSLTAFAQQQAPPPEEGGRQGKRGEKVEALKIAFITEKLNLTTAEAQQFWPIYNEHHAKMREIRAPLKDAKNLDTMTDAEAEKMMATYFDVEQRALNLQKEYFGQLKKVLSVRKIAKLHRAEREFKNRLIDHIGGGNGDAAPPQQRRNPPPPARPRGRFGRF